VASIHLNAAIYRVKASLQLETVSQNILKTMQMDVYLIAEVKKIQRPNQARVVSVQALECFSFYSIYCEAQFTATKEQNFHQTSHIPKKCKYFQSVLLATDSSPSPILFVDSTEGQKCFERKFVVYAEAA